MVIRSNNPWETQSRSELVSIGSHELNVSTSGPPRHSGQAVLIFYTGGGAPAVVYTRLQRLLSQFLRVYFYDRTGYDRSECGCQQSLTAQNAALELQTLLREIAVEPPYVLVGHSYGGILMRAFLETQLPDAVQGLVLADTATELMFELFPQVPDSSLEAIAEGIDWNELTHFRRNSNFTDQEWEAAMRAVEKSIEASRAEDTHGSGHMLAHCRQYQRQILEDWPVVVTRCDIVKDFQLLYEEGVRMGNGTTTQRAQARAFIDRLDTFDDEIRASQTRLSRRHRYVFFSDHGHDDIIRRPEAYVKEVRWVMEQQQAIQQTHDRARRGPVIT